MQYIQLDPSKCEALRAFMKMNDWIISHQDVGQTELCGYGYMIQWQKDDQKVNLHYEDHQGKEMANLELTPCACAEIDTFLAV